MEHTEQPLCPDPQCDAVAALLATAALGGDLNADEQALMLAYLSTCARCRLRLDGFAHVAQSLPLSVPEAAPSPTLRAQIVARASQNRPAQPAVRRPRPPWRRRLNLGLGALAIMLLLFTGQQSVRLQSQLTQQQQQTARNRAVVVAAFGNDDSLEARFVPGAGAPEASGRVLVSASEPAVVVYAKRLPPLAAGRTYRVWLMGAGRVIDVGTFTPDANDRAWALLQPQTVLPTPEAVFITEEAVQGQGQPNGFEVLRAQFP